MPSDGLIPVAEGISYAHRQGNDMHTCATDDCTKPAKTRGLCSTHYNRTRPSRHRKVTVQCHQCGKPCSKEPSQMRRYPRSFCSARCRDDSCRVGYAPPSTCTDLAIIPPAPSRAQPKVAPRPTTRVFTSYACVICGKWAVDLFGSKTCGTACQEQHHRNIKQDAKQRRRARKSNAFVAPVYRQKIWARDNFTCMLCWTPMDMSQCVPHPKAPTIDHIIALANGGTHEPSNAQSACFLCNARKGDRLWSLTDVLAGANG